MSTNLGCRTARNLGLAAASVGLALLVSSPAADAQSNEGSIKSNQFSLAYRIEGTGTPAIVIGFPNYYRRVFSAGLRSHLRLVFADHRGSASSPGNLPLSEYSLDKITDDIELVRSQLGLGPVVIMGHSGHALIALEYAKRYPESVSHVVMIGIAPDLSDEREAEAERYWEKLASSERKAALEKNWKDVPEEEPPESFPGESFVNSYVRNGPLAWYDYEFDSTPFMGGRRREHGDV